MANWTEESIEVAGVRIEMLKGGSGDPLLVLHGAGGNPGWLQYHDGLAEHFQVLVPSHPGFGQSERPEWIETISDVTHFYFWLMRDLGLERVHLMGLSMGGWLAAEMAAMCSHSFRSMVLVDPVGIKPTEGEIADVFLLSPEQVTEILFHDTSQVPEYQKLFGEPPSPERQAILARNREMAVRLCWKPYMYNPHLPHLLEQVRIPSLVIFGRNDALVPVICGEQYHNALAGSTLKIIDNCGHNPQMEKPEEFLTSAIGFMKGI